MQRHISDERFQRCFDLLWRKLVEEQLANGYSSHVSFRSGVVWDEEGYKYGLANNAKEALQKYPIIEAAVDILWGGTYRNNLVNEQHQINTVDKIGRDKEKAKSVLKDIFDAAQADERIAFENAYSYFKYYDVVSYFFFAKDSSRFFSVRPNSYGSRLQMLGCSPAYTSRCTWENYQEYLQILCEIRDYLLSYLNEPVTIIDAESFLWMQYKIAGISITGVINEQKIEPLNTRVIGGLEGRKVEYYTTKYERDRRLRQAAIELNFKERGYKCSVCGFDFEEKYGELGSAFIEVHHKRPLSMLDGETQVDPATDLVCLCSNCHSMVHRKRNAIVSIEELREIVNRNANGVE